jgi:uncharacterized protein YcnI
MPRFRTALIAVATAAAALVIAAAPASAHNEWEPESAAPGSIASLTLKVEDEQPDAGTNKVELFFPQPITITELPAVTGWTAAPMEGSVGQEASGVTWQGGPAADDLDLPIRLGPLPDQPGRLQFKVVQTYDNGVVDRWIDEWPEGAPEPEHPGPVLDLVPGAAGEIPATTAAPTTTTAPTTTATTTPVTTAGASENAASDSDDDGGVPAAVWIIGGLVVLALIAAGVYALMRRDTAPPAADADAPDAAATPAGAPGPPGEGGTAGPGGDAGPDGGGSGDPA